MDQNRSPSLCGYCLKPGKGFYVEIDKKYWASCSMKHMDKIKERIEKGESLGIVATSNPEGVDYALKQIKENYIAYAKKNGSWELHKWDLLDKKYFFQIFLSHYLSYESKLANRGMDGYK